MVVVVFQSAFHAEMDQNDIFFFKKIIFEISVTKQSKAIKKLFFHKKKQILNFLKIQVDPHFQTLLKYVRNFIGFGGVIC